MYVIVVEQSNSIGWDKKIKSARRRARARFVEVLFEGELLEIIIRSKIYTSLSS
jgi:hypothetical protein